MEVLFHISLHIFDGLHNYMFSSIFVTLLRNFDCKYQKLEVMGELNDTTYIFPSYIQFAIVSLIQTALAIRGFVFVSKI
jgi:hypothetical protein